MRNEWKHTANIRPTLARAHNDEITLTDAARAIYTILSTRLPKKWADTEDAMNYDWQFVDILDALKEDSFDDVEEFDDMLAGLYDWADSRRVWLG